MKFKNINKKPKPNVTFHSLITERENKQKPLVGKWENQAKGFDMEAYQKQCAESEARNKGK